MLKGVRVMCSVRKMHRWRPRAVGCLSSVALLISATIVVGQPANAPPNRITVEEAEAKLGGSTLVTLNLKDAAPNASFEALASQAKISFDDYNARSHFAKLGKINFDYQAKPAWHVLRELAGKLEVTLHPYDHPRFDGRNNGVIVRINPGNDPDLHGPACERGPFLIVASRAARSLSLAPSPSIPSIQRVVLEFVLLVDPKVRTRGEPEGFDLEIIDDQGRVLEVEKSQAATWTREVASHSPLIWKVTAWAQIPDAGVKTLKQVSGTLRFITTTNSQPWEVKNVLQAESTLKKIDGTSFVVRSVTPCDYAGPAFAATFGSWGRGETADFGWPPPSMYDRVSAVRLLDAEGNHLRAYHWQEQENRDLMIIFKSANAARDGDGAPETLVWDLPTEVSEIEVPFTFMDIPLP